MEARETGNTLAFMRIDRGGVVSKVGVEARDVKNGSRHIPPEKRNVIYIRR